MLKNVFLRTTLLFIATLFTFSSQAQDEEPVKWSYEVKDNGCSATIIIKPTIDPGWHVYSQKQVDPIGPLPTVFAFEKDPHFKTVGAVRESKTKQHKTSEGTVEVYLPEPVTFKQKIKKRGSEDFKVKLLIDYQTCNDVTCVFRKANLVIPISAGSGCDPIEGEDAPATEETPAGGEEVVAGTGAGMDANCCNEIKELLGHKTTKVEKRDEPIGWQFISKVDEDSTNFHLSFRPLFESPWNLYFGNNRDDIDVVIEFDPSDDFEIVDGLKLDSIMFKQAYDSVFQKDLSRMTIASAIQQQIRLKNPKGEWPIVTGKIKCVASNGEKLLVQKPLEFELDLTQATLNEGDSEMSESYLVIFIFAFFGGLAALLTPCVFPMIPMTVSFFTKQSKTKAAGIRNAITYGLSIIVIYVILGLGVTAIFGPAALNAMSTNVYFNIFFFILLVVFAFSFLGAFEIALPSSWVNKADKQADRGGFIGIFFMAFTLALVSFSCTGPIIGTLLVEAADQGVMGPLFGMLGFSTALALPFALFAAFPGWLNSLPQSGGWLNSVKVFLGFLELALAFKFLSNADLVVQAHLLERELFLAIWVVIFSLLGLYLLGMIKLPHDSDLPHIKPFRLVLAILTFTLVIYMIPGLWGAPLKLISGFPPPAHYSESPYGIGGKAPSHDDLPHGGHFGPHELLTFHDYDEGIAYAKEVGKPVMLDFTGYACVNCRKMEENVWSDKEILPILEEEVVIISLHVDDKTELPEGMPRISPHSGKAISQVGDYWSEMQSTLYGANSQPQYFILDHQQQKLTPQANFQDHGSSPVFLKWLNKGLQNFKDLEKAEIHDPKYKIIEWDSSKSTVPAYSAL